LEKLVEEDLGSVSASVGDLIATDSGDMAIKSWDFGPSSITEEVIAKMLKESCFPPSRVKIPPSGQTVPEPEEEYAVVFRDFFTYHYRRHVFCLVLHALPSVFHRALGKEADLPSVALGK
jgi:hypothetical protein